MSARIWGGAALAVIGVVALALPPASLREVTWEDLLAPYSRGAPLPDGFRITDIRRGSGDVIIVVGRPDDAAVVEVHVIARGRWPGVRESRSFGIAYEIPRSSADQREAITEALATAVRTRDGGLPSPDAISLRLGDVSVLPWGLEMLRGSRGMLIGATVIVLAVMLLVRADGLALAGAMLGIADVAMRAIGVPSFSVDVGAPWTLAAAALLAAWTWRGGWACSRADRLAVAIAATLALALRLALGPWGPLHVNGYAARFIMEAVGHSDATSPYGPGYAEIFAPVATLLRSRPDTAIFAANALISALLAPTAFALARGLGLDRYAASAVALLVAIDPVAIAMAATESYFPILTLLSTAAAVLLCLAPRDVESGFRWRATVAVIAAGLLLVQAVRTHPVGWTVAATIPFVALAGRASLRHRVAVFVAAAAVAAGLAIATSAGPILDVVANMRGGRLMRPPIPSVFPLVWLAMAVTAYVLLVRDRWLAVPAGVAVAVMLLTQGGFGQSSLWQQCYDRLYLILPLIAAVAVLPQSLLRRRWVAATALLLLLFGWARFGVPIVAARTTDQLEYAWVREQVARLAPSCRVIYLGTAEMRAMALPTYTGAAERPAVAIDPRDRATIETALTPAPCLYYIRTSLCSSAEGRAACEALERRLLLAPQARASFPAVPSSPLIPYDRDRVETVVARVDQVVS